MLSTRPVSPEHPLSAPPGPPALPALPARCIALYNFSAENPDEINMVRHEDIYTSLSTYLRISTCAGVPRGGGAAGGRRGRGLGPGPQLQRRAAAHDYSVSWGGLVNIDPSYNNTAIAGEVGFVPKSYLELIMRKEGRLPPNSGGDFMGQPLGQHGLSFSSVDYIAPGPEYHPLESIPEGVTVHFKAADMQDMLD